MIKIRIVVWHSVAADCEMHDSINHRLTQCHVCMLLGNDYAQWMCVINFFQYSAKCLKCYTK